MAMFSTCTSKVNARRCSSMSDGLFDTVLAAGPVAAQVGAQAVGIGNPAGPLVRALTARVAGDAAGYVHLGATSQDVGDTAAMLVTHRALTVLDVDLRACAAQLAHLAEIH